MSIPTSGLATLANLPAPEAYVRIRIVCLGGCVEHTDFDAGHQRSATFPRHPVGVYWAQPLLSFSRDSLVDVALHLVKTQNRRIINSSKWLQTGAGLLEEAHHLFERVFGALTEHILSWRPMQILAIVQLTQELDIIVVHAIRDANAVFDRRAEANVRRGLREDLRIQLIILDALCPSSIWRWNVTLLASFGSKSCSIRGADDGLQMEFLVLVSGCSECAAR